MQVCHRDLKLENVLLDESLPLPRIKICDFGYSKHSVLHSRPKSTVGTPAYIAPEVLQRKEYDGKMADVWSCGALLYTMVVGSYPFEDPKDRKNYKRMVERIAAVDYKIPDNAQLSEPGRVLLSRIFVADPARRITMREIRRHPWFMQKLPSCLSELVQSSYYEEDRYDPSFSGQSLNQVMNIIEDAKTLPPALRSLSDSEWDDEDQVHDNSDSEGEEEVTQGTCNLNLKDVQAHQEDKIKKFNIRQEQEAENECNSRAKEAQARWNDLARIRNQGLLRIRSG